MAGTKICGKLSLSKEVHLDENDVSLESSRLVRGTVS